MREIKFRAWDSTHKLMLTIRNWNFQEHLVEGVWKWQRALHDCGGGEKAYEIMQYTGFKDKNGIEIYEGDIVKHPYKKISKKADVRWWLLGFGFHYGNDGFGKYCTPINNLEVIGNIYENPELLDSLKVDKNV